jgi:hypothetical protein
MHGDDARRHQQPGDDQSGSPECRSVDDEEAEPGDGNRKGEREERGPEVVFDLHPRHAEGQHGNEVHGPDAAAHDRSGSGKPCMADPPLRGANPSGKIESGVGGRRRDQDGKRDQDRIMSSNQSHLGCGYPRFVSGGADHGPEPLLHETAGQVRCQATECVSNVVAEATLNYGKAWLCTVADCNHPERLVLSLAATRSR